MGKRIGNRGPIFWGSVAVVTAIVVGGVGWLIFGGDSETLPEEPAEESWAWSEEGPDDEAEAEARPAEESTEEAESPVEGPSPEETVAEVEEVPGEAESPAEESHRVTAESETPARLPVSGESEKPESPSRVRVGQSGKTGRMPEEYKPAVLRIVTNFEKADATVNGLPYPEYSEQSDQKGMVLPAGGPYTVKVTYDGKSKSYRISLRPYEVRYLMVELSGFKGGGPVTPAPSRKAAGGDSAKPNSQNNEKGRGRVTVYSKPKGTVHVDGNPKKQQTPGTVQVEAGQHNIQVKFDSGEMSESKTVRVRKGSRIKLFFRKRD